MHINTRFSFHVSLTDFWKKKWFRDEGLSNGLSSDRVDSLHILQIGYKNLPLYSYLRSIIDHGVQIQQANERKQSSKQGEGLVAKKKKKFICRDFLMAFSNPYGSSLLLPFRVPRRSCLEGEINPSPSNTRPWLLHVGYRSARTAGLAILYKHLRPLLKHRSYLFL